MDYLRAFRHAESKLQTSDYVGCIRDCGTIAELGLKELYVRQKDWEESEGRVFRVLEEFRETHTEFCEFDPEKSSLFPLLKFYSFTNLWERIQVRVESNLHFTRRIPWHDLRYVRNVATHSFRSFTREQAVEFLHHIKLFLHETELAATNPSVLFENKTECHGCQMSLRSDWNYCPSCGIEQRVKCYNCSRSMEVTWKTCPHCEASRTVDLFVEETNRLYKAYCEAVWTDDVVNAEERELLRRKRLELGISEETAEQIEAEVIDKEVFQFIDLINAVLIDGVIDDIEMEFLMNKAEQLKIDTKRAKRLINSMYSERRTPVV